MKMCVSDLSAARGGVQILEGVSFELTAGETLVLRGPNGIGKTTVLRTIAGLQPALAGKIEAPEESIAYAGHADGVKSTLSVAENLRFWAEIFGTNDIAPALERYDLESLQDRPAGALSAGQKRRLGLSRLMVTGRPIWIFDEPTVSIDVAATEMFANAVRAHIEAGGAALMATHIDLGLKAPRILDLGPYKAKPKDISDFDEAFL